MKIKTTSKKPKIFSISFASIYPLYLKKVERKNGTKDQVDKIIYWLTGYDANTLQKCIDEKIDIETFFEKAPQLNPNASLIKGTICGYKIQEIQDPLMKKIRYLDKLIDELYYGKSMDRILRAKL
jgi:hypothetical protein